MRGSISASRSGQVPGAATATRGVALQSEDVQTRQVVRLSTDAAAAREARAAVRDALGDHQPEIPGSLVADCELVAAELVTNAVLHGEPPVELAIAVGTSVVRIEVSDNSRDVPMQPIADAEAMTGRGLALVATLATRWGFEPTQRKVVWAELARNGKPVTAQAELDAATLLAQWSDPFEDATGPQRVTVRLGDVPTDLLLAAKAHVDNLVREFTLAAAGAATGATTPLPPHLSDLIEVVMRRFAEPRQAIKRQALAAASRGDARTTLTLSLPVTAADAGEDYLAALDEADSYARAVRLLTLETPPQHRAFRQWYVRALVDQLREVAAGRSPNPPPSFEQHLLSELGTVVTAQQVSERAARLQAATAALASATTPEEVAQIIISEGVAAMDASGGGLLMPGDDERLALPGAIGYPEDVVRQLLSEAPDAELPGATALRTGIPVWLESRQERDDRFPALVGLEPQTISMCAVPLQISDRTVGALRFSFDRPQLFDADMRGFVLALAAQAALALERGRLLHAERAARERTTFLAEATTRLTSSLDAKQTIAELARLLVPKYADWVTVYLQTEAGDARPVRFIHRDPDIGAKYLRAMQGSSLDRHEAGGIAEVLRTGRTIRYPVVPEEMQRRTLRALAPDDPLAAAMSPTTALSVPLAVHNEIIGAVGLMRGGGPAYDESDQQIVEDIATRAAVAIANARRFERERDAAITLQRSLLPQQLPQVSGVSLAWRYLPAGTSTMIGGDWYDVLELDHQRVALVIGDVMGRGLGAAAVMGQLRATARAFASAQLTPALILSQMDRAVTRLEQAQITTAAVAILDVPARKLTIASAGHLPPLVVVPPSESRYAPVEPGPPLGAGTPDYPETTVQLPDGAILLLYTDGLVEERERPIDVGLEQLRQAAIAATDPEDLCERALNMLGETYQHEDDTAMLAVAVRPA